MRLFLQSSLVSRSSYASRQVSHTLATCSASTSFIKKKKTFVFENCASPYSYALPPHHQYRELKERNLVSQKNCGQNCFKEKACYSRLGSWPRQPIFFLI